MFTFLISWGQYVTTLLIGGGSFVTLPLVLFPFLSGANHANAAAISLVFVAPAVIVLVMTSRQLGRDSSVMGGFRERYDETYRCSSFRDRFGDHLAVRELNLDIESGEMVAFLGPSGCGKTTTLRMITGLLQPSSGDVLFNGKSVVDIPTEKRRGAVMVFQKHLLFPTMNVAQNVGFGLKMSGVDKKEINRRVTEILELVELPELETRKAHELSGGQQQRVALARALVVQPQVLLLDEPLANLDANLRITMRQLIRNIQSEMGITAIFVTHDQEEAVMLADRVALMFDGVLQQVGEPDAFYQRPRTTRVARFFRNSNLLPGVKTGAAVETAVGRIEVDEQVSAADGPVVLTVRPEEVRIADSDSGAANVVPAVIKSVIYMGTHTQLIADIGGSTWSVQGPATMTAEEGARIEFELPKKHLWIVEDDSVLAADEVPPFVSPPADVPGGFSGAPLTAGETARSRGDVE